MKKWNQNRHINPRECVSLRNITWTWSLSLLIFWMSWSPLAVGSKKTMALRQANSVSSKLIERKGSTSSVITRTPISRTAASWNSKFEYVWQSVLYIIYACLSWLLESRWSRLFPSLWGPWEWSCRCPRVTFRGVSSIFLQHPVTDVRQHERVIAQPRTWKQWLTRR